MMKKILIVCCICVVVAGVSFYVFTTVHRNADPTTRDAKIVVVDENSYAFSHPRYLFSFTYPKELLVDRIKEGNASETIVFKENSEETSIKGFQIFITPYGDTVITQERLEKDIPNGDIREPQEVMIGEEGNIRAMIFKSSLSGIGETRELWFIHDGFIYEFTVPIALDNWLVEILDTWEFSQ